MASSFLGSLVGSRAKTLEYHELDTDPGFPVRPVSDARRKTKLSLTLLMGFLSLATGSVAGEKLYNGIVLPEP